MYNLMQGTFKSTSAVSFPFIVLRIFLAIAWKSANWEHSFVKSRPKVLAIFCKCRRPWDQGTSKKKLVAQWAVTSMMSMYPFKRLVAQWVISLWPFNFCKQDTSPSDGSGHNEKAAAEVKTSNWGHSAWSVVTTRLTQPAIRWKHLCTISCRASSPPRRRWLPEVQVKSWFLK